MKAKMKIIAIVAFALALVSCATNGGYSSAFKVGAMYYKHDIEDIRFTIPKEKATDSLATLQFLDANNRDAVAYEMPFALKKGKCSYRIKSLPSSCISGITREMFLEYQGGEYEWDIHLRLIFEDGSSHAFDDSSLILGAMFKNDDWEWDGVFQWEERGKAVFETETFSFILPEGYKEFKPYVYNFLGDEYTEADVFSSVAYSYWSGFDMKKIDPERFAVAKITASYPDSYPFAEFANVVYEKLVSDYSPKKVTMETTERFVKITISKNRKMMEELYLFEGAENYGYLSVYRRKKNSELEKAIPEVVNSMKVK